MSKPSTVVVLLANDCAVFFGFMGIAPTLLTCGFGTMLVVSPEPGPYSLATPVAGSATLEGSSAPVAWLASLLWILSYAVDQCVFPPVCRLWAKGLDLSACGILCLTDLDELLKLRLDPFEIHYWYALVLKRPAIIEFLISQSLQSPAHAKLHSLLLSSPLECMQKGFCYLGLEF